MGRLSLWPPAITLRMGYSLRNFSFCLAPIYTLTSYPPPPSLIQAPRGPLARPRFRSLVGARPWSSWDDQTTVRWIPLTRCHRYDD